MTQRITITLPDKLFEELQAVKENENINVSKICQEAIMQSVSAAKVAQNGDLVGFLKASKQSYEKRYYDMGMKSALEYIDLKEIDYEIFLQFEKIVEVIKGNMNYENAYALFHEVVGWYRLWDQLSEELKKLERDEPSFNPNVFLVGFAEGVTKAWEKLKDKV